MLGAHAEEPRRKHVREQEREKVVLPVDTHADVILAAVRKHVVTFVNAETGSGKSTQIPQLLRAQIHNLNLRPRAEKPKVVMVQPRRIAAISLASYVARCAGQSPGQVVGHEVRFNRCRSQATEIIYVTEGILLNWLRTGDSILDSIGVFVLDEVHERSITLDIICGTFVAQPELLANARLLLMSATTCYDDWYRFFSDFSVTCVRIPGRLYPIQTRHIDTLDRTLLGSDHMEVLVKLIHHLHTTSPLTAGILVFLPGQAEINQAFRLLQKSLRRSDASLADESTMESELPIALFRLHSLVPLTEQERCLSFHTNEHSAECKKRKVVLATTIAETSLTVAGIQIVIDSGLVRLPHYYPTMHMTTLETVQCSQEQADQRRGRAGREGPGQCFRLYTERCYLERRQSVEPEICRVRCEDIILWVSSNRLRLRSFPFISPPPVQNLAAAYDELHALNIVDRQGSLTDRGALTIAFPALFQHGRMLAEVIADARDGKLSQAAVYRQLVIVVAAVETFMNTDLSIQWDADMTTAAQTFQSDHLAFVLLYKSYAEARYKMDWCQQFSIPYYLMRHFNELVQQLTDVILAKHPALAQIEACTDLTVTVTSLKRYLKVGYRLQQAYLNTDGSYTLSDSSVATEDSKPGVKLAISTSSLIKGLFPRNLLFSVAIRVTDVTMHIITQIDT